MAFVKGAGSKEPRAQSTGLTKQSGVPRIGRAKGEGHRAEGRGQRAKSLLIRCFFSGPKPPQPASFSCPSLSNNYLLTMSFKGCINLYINLLLSVIISAVPVISLIKLISIP